MPARSESSSPVTAARDTSKPYSRPPAKGTSVHVETPRASKRLGIPAPAKASLAVKANRPKDSRRNLPAVDKIDPSTVVFPVDVLSRSRFRTGRGKALTPHQWKVYDFILQIPPGRISTYGSISKTLSSSAQAVGNALRENPFAPRVPCHRVISTSLHIGGFQGSTDGIELERKVALCKREGILFDDKGMLVGGKDLLWSP
ncbi:hypothetical protein P7C70_g4232, partial [Phenoliferia sp. Uapishka_3]